MPAANVSVATLVTTAWTVSLSFFSALVTMHGARFGRLDRLVDVDADAVEVRVAHGLERALAGEARDLEDHVGVLVDELLGDRATLGRVVEALGRIRIGLLVEDLDIRLDRLRAVLVAAPVVDDRRDVRATDGADRAALERVAATMPAR